MELRRIRHVFLVRSLVKELTKVDGSSPFQSFSFIWMQHLEAIWKPECCLVLMCLFLLSCHFE